MSGWEFTDPLVEVEDVQGHAVGQEELILTSTLLDRTEVGVVAKDAFEFLWRHAGVVDPLRPTPAVGHRYVRPTGLMRGNGVSASFTSRWRMNSRSRFACLMASSFFSDRCQIIQTT